MNIFHHFYVRLAGVFLVVTLLVMTGIYYFFENRAGKILHNMVIEETVWFDQKTEGLHWGDEADHKLYIQTFEKIAVNRGFSQMLITSTKGEEYFYYQQDNTIRKLVPEVDISAPEKPGDILHRLVPINSGYQLLFSARPDSVRGKAIVWAMLPMDTAFAEQFRNTTLIAILIILITVVTMALAILPLIIRSCKTVEIHWRDLQRSYLSTIQALGRTIAKRDQRTNKHNFRVAYYALRLGEDLDLPTEQLRSLTLGAVLHDIGKIGIPDQILNKPGKLDDSERKIMQSHVVKGIEIIDNIDWLQQAKTVIGAHHERFDGHGYPAGIQGENIAIEARVFAVVDVFDALICDRPYKAAMPFNDVIEHIEKNGEGHFDPHVVQTFITIAAEMYREVGTLNEAELQIKLQQAAANHFPELMVI